MNTFGKDNTKLMEFLKDAMVEKKLVIGYMTQTAETEVLYSVDISGNFKKSNPIKRPNNSFNYSTNWAEIKSIPANAEYIGTYPS